MTAADCLIETLHEWGVDVVFGLPGDGIIADGFSCREQIAQTTVRIARHFIEVWNMARRSPAGKEPT